MPFCPLGLGHVFFVVFGFSLTRPSDSSALVEELLSFSLFHYKERFLGLLGFVDGEKQWNF